ncbi:choice-of-anchor D domain-containing protein [Psychroserpens burtonensis]|uniref:Choice-of-anchor D domain-containing protein n=1 Tax=Psychroserpens burtonensis TaxID=49278 RepID=A0A5C7BGF0_9FLAO|nr:choice-of-anchor D domain-containing protein [Psychroserpens burtonensis]TXE17831.1 choice-of-anchor D domain-containing protein [Psychroserpens burtonensis]
MKKNYALVLIAFLCAVWSGYGQVPTTIDFETNLAGYSHSPSQLPSADSGDRYFHRAMPGDAAIYESGGPYTNVTGNWMFVGSNPAEINGGNSGILTLNSINVSGFSNLELSIDFGAVPNDWDDLDELSVEYNFDGGAWNTMYHFSHSNGYNDPLVLIGNTTGGVNTANGAVLTYALQTITSDNFTGIGTNLNIRIVCDSNANYEAFGLDNIVLNGDPNVTSDPILAITGTTDHGSSCISAAATSLQYTITNSGTLSAAGISVTSDNSQFVVSGLSSATIAASGTATYNVIFTPTSVGNQNATITVTSSTATSNSPTIDLTGLGITNPTITTQPTNQNEVIPNTATFSVVSSDATSYQWEVSTDGGSTWLNVTGGTGATTNSYTTGATSAPMNMNQYQCVVTNSCGFTLSNVATLTIEVLADVVITEIMYNTPTPGIDYEWIEICNLNGSAENISNYTIDVNGTTRYTFPASAVIPANSCITVVIGNDGSSSPECPFTADYSNPIGTTNILPNVGGTVTLESPANDIVDSVFYDDADSGATNGNGSSFHVIDATEVNSNTDTNWQAVLTGGSPGDNTLVSPCSTPELQLVDDSNTNRDCGSFTIGFGVQALGFDTDLTFDIDNDGALNLNISSLVLGGTDSGDYSIVSPATPFTMPPGSSQTVTVRFNTTNLGASSATLTINSNDTDESSCVIDLTGTGTSPAPNIIVRGVIGSDPTIANGSTSTSGLNNTLYAQQTINATQLTKSFRIANEGGTADLTVSNITLTGDTADFFVTSSFTNPFAAETSQDFTITFQPTTLSGFRSVTVSIANSDPNKNPYTFVVGGTANCPSVSGTLSPIEGPAGTTVTILSPGNDLTGATATLNGVALTTISDTTAELVVRLPNTITVGGPLSVQLTTSCVFSNTFTLLNDTISGCETSTSATVSDLFISEVTDSPSGSLTYVELYNATGATINFATTNYSIVLYNNGNTTAPKTLVLDSGSVTNNSTYVIAMGVLPASSQCAVAGGDGSLAQIEQSLVGASINFFREVSEVDNPNLGHDFISLNSPAAITGANPNGIVDAWGTSGDETWATGLGLNNKGANFQRDTSSIIPNPDPNFIATAWIITDWNDTDCSDVDYSTMGAYDFSTGVAPTVTLQPIDPTFACNFSASLTIAGIEGFDEPTDTQDLEYRWFFNAPGSNTWDEILTSNTSYTGQQSVTLNILDTSNFNDYQYYCQVREDNITCYIATNAVLLDIRKSVWDGTNWSSPPAIDSIVFIDGDYDTSVGGPNNETSFEACQLIVNTGHTLSIENNTFVRVQNNLTVNGNIIIKTDGSFVQVDDLAIVDGDVLTDKTKITVEKETAFLNTYQEYTYWSSPVSGETIEDGLNEASAVRRFWFNAQNYLDETQETNNDDATLDGQDDIDDDANDWTPAAAASTMLAGVGYASTLKSFLFTFPARYKYDFQGPFNNGIITVPIYRNDVETMDNNWNFIGNPYPSAIDADLFLTANTSIDQTVGSTSGAIFFWSHKTNADGTTNGNENLNYSQSDYAIINGSGQTMGGDLLMPTRHIPSGQGFFVSMDDGSSSTLVGGTGTIRTTDVIFNNSMRVTGNNDQFFRNNSANQDNKIWLNLTSDNGVFNQILVAYIDGATDGNDGMYFDASKNLSTNANSIIYSIIENSTPTKFAIQGKEPNSLDTEEIIPIGFYTSIDDATLYTFSIYQLEGEFMTTNTVYLKDMLMNITHNLSSNDYTFTSETGEFNDRFEIVFQPESLSINENEVSPNDLTIIELSNGDVKFSVGKNMTINAVEILDILGRTIYKLRGQNNTETYNLSQLSQAAYIARVTLSNDQTITKKAVKTN